MKQKQIYILPIMVLMTVFLVSLVSASEINVTAPLTGTNHSGSITVSCQYANDTFFTNPETANCSFAYDGTDISYTGFTVTPTLVSVTINTALLTDGTGYEISCVLGNDTAMYGSNTNISEVTFDNTNPTITMTTDYSEVSLHRYFDYTIAIADATSGLDGSENCNVTDPHGDTVTGLSTSATKTVFEDTGIPGNYNITCRAVDYTGNNNTDSVSVLVKTAGDPIKREVGIDLGGITDIFKGIDQKTWIIIIVVIVIIALAIQKKKR